MKYKLAALGSGALFGLGLSIAGMTDPQKVLAFLDVAGNWDPSLLFVLGSAVIVTFAGYRLALRQPRPVLAESFGVPNFRQIDRPLLLGSVVFGIGWGIAGYCPGPAIASLAFTNTEALVFLPALALGSWLHLGMGSKQRLIAGAAQP